MTAGNVERDHHPVALPKLPNLRPDLLHDPHRLVTEDVTRVEERTEYLIEVQIGATDTGRRHPDDRIGRLLDLRIRDLVNAHVTRSVPSNCLHHLPSRSN